MLFLVTGTPGAGKTLNTIAEHLNSKNVIYYLGIPELSPDLGWIEIFEEDFYNWTKREWVAGALIIIDEAQMLMPQRTKSKVPEYIEALSKHRHFGIDFLFITQHPSMIDAFARRLIGKHIHYHRPFGLRSTTRFEKETVMPNPARPLDRWGAMKKRVKLDKKIFGLYKSTVQDTQTKKIPFKLLFILLAIIGGFVFFGVLLYNVLNMTSPSGSFDSSTVTPSGVPPVPHTQPKRLLDSNPDTDYYIVSVMQLWETQVCWISKGTTCKLVDRADTCLITPGVIGIDAVATYNGVVIASKARCPDALPTNGLQVEDAFPPATDLPKINDLVGLASGDQ